MTGDHAGNGAPASNGMAPAARARHCRHDAAAPRSGCSGVARVVKGVAHAVLLGGCSMRCATVPVGAACCVMVVRGRQAGNGALANIGKAPAASTRELLASARERQASNLHRGLTRSHCASHSREAHRKQNYYDGQHPCKAVGSGPCLGLDVRRTCCDARAAPF